LIEKVKKKKKSWSEVTKSKLLISFWVLKSREACSLWYTGISGRDALEEHNEVGWNKMLGTTKVVHAYSWTHTIRHHHKFVEQIWI